MQARHYFWLSTAAAVATICLKYLAWSMTGSMGLLSDAMESFVNLAGATFALWMITIAKTPPDIDHPLGHSKAEYFSSGLEGILIFGAAGAFIYSAAIRLFDPQPLESVGLGLGLSLGASLINLFMAIAMRKASVRYRSIALEGGARHVYVDVLVPPTWTIVQTHTLLDEVGTAICARLPDTHVLTHPEPAQGGGGTQDERLLP